MYKYIKIQIIIAIVFALSNCYISGVSTYHNNFEDGFQKIPIGSKLLIAPLNEIYTMYAGGGAIVTKEVFNQLSDAGYQVRYLTSAEYLSLWKGILEELGGITKNDGSLSLSKTESALKRIGKELSLNNRDFYVLIPAFSVKEVELKMGIAEWDGVKRDVMARNSRGFQPTYSNAGQIKTTYSLHGYVSGLSLELHGFNLENKWSFTTYGGLFVPDMFYNNKGTLRSKEKEEMFSNNKLIIQGVKVALEPITQYK